LSAPQLCGNAAPVTLCLFGLTGGVASGKSTVAARFVAGGLDVIDADRLARELVEPGRPALADVVAAFGGDMLLADGALDRKKLGALVFADAEARARLNAILHPAIAAETRSRAAALAGRGVRLACYEAALLVENGLAHAFRPLVVVAASLEVQRARLCARDGIDAAEADRRLAAQLPLAEKTRVADYVLDNDGSREALEARADALLRELRARHG
jgi:dephospho-CoA kinase